ncbi:MAG: hypothetical protein QME60_03360 [Verrucomicrobiota bacterium]|nr:hypothetical protein [Verrucomicrobiota bacterium]
MNEPEKKDSAESGAPVSKTTEKRRFALRRQRAPIRWNPRDAKEIRESAEAVLARREPGARLRIAIGIGAVCLLVVAVALVVVFPPRSPLPPIRTLCQNFRKAGVVYRTSQVHVGDEAVTLHTVAIPDLTGLKGIPIKGLYVKNTNVTDIAPLQGMPLEHLVLWDTRVADLTPLGGTNAPNLRSLDIRGAAVTNLAPLRGKPLKYLGFEAGLATNGIEAIREMTSLELINKMPAREFWRRYDRGDFRLPAPAEPAANAVAP